MPEFITEIFNDGTFWEIFLKVLITTLLTAGIGYLGTLIGKIISKNKNSKIYKYADTCVKAAEQKFPNEGKKMGPEKLQYVMDQMMIKFPKIRDNQYLYNIAEAAVFELNRQKQKEAAVKEFEEKYGEKPLAIPETNDMEDIENKIDNTIITLEDVSESTINENPVNEDIPEETKVDNTPKQVQRNRLQSF